MRTAKDRLITNGRGCYGRLTTNGVRWSVRLRPEEAGLRRVSCERWGRRRRGWEHLVRLGCQGWLGCASAIGCCWVPAGDAGMAEGLVAVSGGWFDTVRRRLWPGSPRTIRPGEIPFDRLDGNGLRGLGTGTHKGYPYKGQAHHEREGWAGHGYPQGASLRGTGSPRTVGVGGARVPTRGIPTRDRLTTNGWGGRGTGTHKGYPYKGGGRGTGSPRTGGEGRRLRAAWATSPQ